MKIKFTALLLAAVLAFSGIVSAAPTVPTIPAMFDSGTLATYNSSAVLQDNVVVLGYSAAKNIYDFKSVMLQAVVDVNTPAAGTFTCAVTDICTDVAHGFTAGLKGQGTTTTTLPAGLSLATDYYVIPLTVDTYSLATSYANAIAGTAIDITDVGTGTHTFTPTSIAGGTISLEGSINGTSFVDITSSSSNVTADASFYWNIDDTFYPFVRIKYVNTAGTFTSTAYWSGKTRP